MKSSLLLLTLSITTQTSAFSLNDWLNNPPYANGGTIQEQITCYALPYGAIGFSSHILTYLTVLALSLGRDPLMPWRPLRHKWLDIGIAVSSFCIGLTMTVLTMVRCRNTWPFILIAVWKQVFSTTLTVMAVHAAREPQNRPQHRPQHRYPPRNYNVILEQPNYQERFRNIWWWCIPYSLGAIVGAVGILALVKNNISSNHQLQIITGVFGGVGLVLVLADVGIYWLASRRSGQDELRYYGGDSEIGKLVAKAANSILVLVGASLFVGTLLFAFYSDWALAALAGDIVGRPTRDNAVYYWLYFAAKRLPMLSI
ncbi:hypothetical protein B0T14DRAFT_474270 [Immersiella caudata]|uniref:Uncharacterized protein n=1 Tax=Immersiella caudata TaxID=314043 RepID=A0AA39X526_9PEZI|nr:hypothetical protein B0T14DRAFT_474270 [Immersiella caudata]